MIYVSKNKPVKVLPNRKVIVERDNEGFGEARDLLCQIALLEEVHEHIMVYRITKRGIWYGGWRKMGADEIIKQLKEISETPIREKLENFIKDATEKYGKIVVRKHTEEDLLCEVKDPDLLSELRRAIKDVRELSRLLTPAEMGFLVSRAHFYKAEGRIIERFKLPIQNKISDATEVSGDRYPPYYHYHYYGSSCTSDQKTAIAQELQRLKTRGKNLAPSSINQNHSSLSAQITRHFESSAGESRSLRKKEALRFAGLDYDKEELEYRRSQVVEEIKDLKKEDFIFSQANLIQEHPGLLNRMYRYFSSEKGSGRKNALRAAGIDPEEEFLRSMREKVKKEILSLHEKNISLSYSNLIENYSGLHTRIVKYFKDYPGEGSARYKAIKYTGLKPEKQLEGEDLWSTLSESQQRDYVEEQVKQLVEEGNLKSLSKNHPKLYSRLYQAFKDLPGEDDPLIKALRYAGFEPEELLEEWVVWRGMSLENKKEWISKKLQEEFGSKSIPGNTAYISPGLYKRILKTFKVEDDSRSSVKEALRYSGFDPEVYELTVYRERKIAEGGELQEAYSRIEDRLQEIKKRGIPLISGFVREESSYLRSQIDLYFREPSSEESPFVRALKFFDLYQDKSRRLEIAKKFAEDKIRLDRLGHLESNRMKKLIVREDVLRLKRAGENLDANNLRENHPVLWRRFSQAFETKEDQTLREQALRFSGLDPKEEKLKVKRKQVKKEISELNQEGVSLTYENLKENYPTLLRKMKKYFSDPSGEKPFRYRAFKAAGIDPYEAMDGGALWKVMERKERKEWCKEQLQNCEQKDGILIIDSEEVPRRTLLGRISRTFEDQPGRGTPKYKALRYAGFEPEEVLSPKGFWRNIDVVQKKNWIKKELRAWIKNNEDPGNISEQRTRLYHRIHQIYKDEPGEGSNIDKAMRYAGIDPETYEIIDDKNKD